MPNWLRIFLLILTRFTFLPQVLALLRRRDVSGISIYYVLFNLVVSTELFTLSFFFVTNQAEGSEIFVHDPPDVGDWLNLAQFTDVCALWLLIFVLSIYFSHPEKRWQNATVVALYTSYLLISVLPAFLNALLAYHHHDSPNADRWFAALFHGSHTLFLAPLITLLAAAALPIQVRTILALPRGSGTGALSVPTLAAQAVVFAVVGATWWPGRLVFPEDLGSPVTYFKAWYSLVGFVPVDYAVFALAQAVLFFVAVWWSHRPRKTDGCLTADAGEGEPLLSR
ncbi:hypothetical protein F5Y01DRAFT_323816 [Xylaria sp. FL0043]|nr:hypothetical protein F5Y01DRAFT_323816 [Xylaria sp. FL0043]